MVEAQKHSLNGLQYPLAALNLDVISSTYLKTQDDLRQKAVILLLTAVTSLVFCRLDVYEVDASPQLLAPVRFCQASAYL